VLALAVLGIACVRKIRFERVVGIFPKEFAREVICEIKELRFVILFFFVGLVSFPIRVPLCAWELQGFEFGL